jgi:hypothetical protein
MLLEHDRSQKMLRGVSMILSQNKLLEQDPSQISCLSKQNRLAHRGKKTAKSASPSEVIPLSMLATPVLKGQV